MRTFMRSAVIAAMALLSISACDEDSAQPEQNAAFTVEVSGEEFTVEVATQAQIDELEARLDSGEEGVINGSLEAGDGGYNGPWSWHLDPETVHAVDASIELCDGRPSMVEADLEYWLDTVGQFCPWGAKVTERIR